MNKPYQTEPQDNSFNIVFKDEENDVKDLVAVAFNFIHAKLIQNTLNEYHSKVFNTEHVEDEI